VVEGIVDLQDRGTPPHAGSQAAQYRLAPVVEYGLGPDGPFGVDEGLDPRLVGSDHGLVVVAQRLPEEGERFGVAVGEGACP
jgi:hypothetical protein